MTSESDGKDQNPAAPPASAPDTSAASGRTGPVISKENFNEAGYLRIHADVAAAVREKRLESGYHHYISSGIREKRALPDGPIGPRNQISHLQPAAPTVPPCLALGANSIEVLFLSRSGGLMITGWIDDSEDPIESIRIRDESWEAILGAELLVRERRPGAEEKLGRHLPKCQSLRSVTRSMKVRTLADNSREVG